MRAQLLRWLLPFAAIIAFGLLGPGSALAAVGDITGTVTDATTFNPIAGVTVTATPTPVGTPITTKTAAGGTYTIAATSGTTYTVSFADSPNNVEQWYNDEPNVLSADPVTAPQSFVDASLTPVTGTITGTVTDAVTHAGIPNIDVEIFNSSDSQEYSATTGSTGKYTVSNVDPNATYVAEFNEQQNNDYPTNFYNGATTFATATSFSVTGGATTANINDALKLQTAHISGTVTSGGAPMAGVDVEAFDPNEINESEGTTTASDGTYTITGLATGSYDVVFLPDNTLLPADNSVYQFYNAKTDEQTATPVSATVGDVTTGINAALATGAIVSGKVTDAGGNPIKGATVQVEDASGSNPLDAVGFDEDDSFSATTAADGTYSIKGLPTGTYVVDVDGPGGKDYAPQYYNGQQTLSTATEISATEGATTANINVALPTGGQISGTVTDGTSGQPMENVGVTVYDSGDDYVESTDTAANGTYTLTGLVTSGSYVVQFSPPGSSGDAGEFYTGKESVETGSPVSVTEGATTANINAALPKGAILSGAVTYGPTGGPLAGVDVSIYDSAGNLVESTFTQPDGTWSQPNLLAGTYKVGFSTSVNLAFQYYNAVGTIAAANVVTATAGQTTGSLNAVLAPGGTMTGTVTDAVTKAVVPGVEVELLDAKGDFLNSTSTLPNGSYTMTGIPSGTYYVEFVPNGTYATNYQNQYYGGVAVLNGSKTVGITAGQTTSNINAALVVVTTPSTTTTIVTAKPGPPTISGGSLSGIGKRKVTLKFKLTAGTNNAPKIKSFRFKLPSGLSFVSKKLKKAVKVTGAKFTDKISGGALVVTLKSPASSVSFSISSAAIKVSKSLAAKAKKHKIASEKVVVQVTDASGRLTSLAITIKKPS
jgi:5-hydroxyisourate hydrolase-like protein (transthyretin family)